MYECESRLIKTDRYVIAFHCTLWVLLSLFLDSVSRSVCTSFPTVQTLLPQVLSRLDQPDSSALIEPEFFPQILVSVF